MKGRRLLQLTLAMLPLTLLAQQQRGVRVVPAGTGEITGVVMSADPQPLPIRRVVVSITGGPLPDARSVITDDAGRFAFTRLPGGEYSINAKKAAYLPTEFGSRKPLRSGSRVALTTGEKRAISLTMFRGAAIGGTLRDEKGVPLEGVTVTALNVRTIGQRRTSGVDPSVTNDRGEYRIYGLTPGDYVVVASPTAGGSGEIGARSASEVDRMLAALSQGRSRPNTSAPPSPPPPPPAIGYSPIYFPGTPMFAEAERIRLNAGDEHAAMNFTVGHVPVASIEGAISGNVSSLLTVQLSIDPEIRGLVFGGGLSAPFTSEPPNEAGEFKYGNLPPGRYRIVARVRGGAPAEPPPPGGRGGARVGGAGSPGSGSGEMLFAVADVELRGQDVKGVSLALQPGGVLSGKIVFDSGGTPVPDDLTTIRVGLSPVGDNSAMVLSTIRIGNMLSAIAPVAVRPDGTFQISGIGPSVYELTPTLPNDLSAVWKLRSAIVDGRDLLDTGVQGPYVDLRGVTLLLSDMRTEIGGSLVSGSGQPALDYYVIAFSTDRGHWRPGSRRTLSARPATNGHFMFRDLPAGEYFIAALTDLDPVEWQDAAFLEQVAPAAIKIRVAEGEKKIQDLRIR